MEFDINNEEQMRDLYEKMAPGGSGPTGLMRIVRQLVKAISQEKGYCFARREVVVGEYSFTKSHNREHTANSCGGTNSWNDKIIDAGLNGVEFEVVLREKCKDGGKE